MALNLLNLYSLIFALFDKIGSMNKEMETMRINTNLLDAALMSSNLPMLSDNSTETNIPSFLTESSKLLMATVSNTMSELSRETEAMWNSFVTPSSTLFPENCRRIEVSCLNKTTITSMAFLTTTVLPEIWNRFNVSPTFDYGSSTLDMENTTYDWLTNFSSTSNDWYSTSDYENFTDNNVSMNFTDLNIISETTTESRTNAKDADYNYDEQYEDYSEGDGHDRRRREVNDIFDEIQRMAWQTSDEFENQTNLYHSNYTELISSTISSFMENLTVSSDYWNTTYVMEMWTNYVNRTEDSMWENETSDSGICYEIVCDEQTTEYNTEDYTTFGNDEKSVGIETTTTQPSTAYPFTCPTIATLPPTTMVSVNDSTRKYVGKNLTKFINHMDITQQTHLRKLCWETMFGQELVKLTVMDLVIQYNAFTVAGLVKQCRKLLSFTGGHHNIYSFHGLFPCAFCSILE